MTVNGPFAVAAALLLAVGASACSNDDGDDTADREVAIEASEYKFTGVESLSATTGETIKFTLANKGTEQHEFEVLQPDGEALGEVEATDPGKTGQVMITFEEAGTYAYQCILEEHDTKGMTGTFTVS